jgi:protein SCO1/2
MKRWSVLFAAVGLAALGFGSMAWWAIQSRGHTFAGLVVDPPQPATDFTLTTRHDQTLALNSLRGQWVLLTYGYTHCPDVCPTTLATLKHVKESLGANSPQVRVVFVSVDPERDTPDLTQQYVKHFGEDFVGLSGSPSAVATAAKSFDVTYQKKDSTSAAGYSVSHSAFVYLIDPQSRWRVTYPFGVTAQEIAADLNYLFTEGHP